MQVHRSIVGLPSFKNAVITIGTFDGVHTGHQKIIVALKQEAEKIDGESVAVTFHPHPRKIVQPDASLQLISTLDERIELLEQQGIDHVVVVPFTKEFSELSAQEYIDDFLLKTFQPKAIIIGYDHRFGKDRKGDYQLLEQYAIVKNFLLVEIPRHVLQEIAISSTKIRKALLESDIEAANQLLGYNFFFDGKVVEGDKLGRQLGYPTANLEYTDAEKIHLGHGVYAVEVIVDQTLKKGMLSIGNRPTLERSDEKIEVNIFDFDEQIYGKVIRIIVKQFLRHQEKYDSLEKLEAQLAKDKKAALEVLNS